MPGLGLCEGLGEWRGVGLMQGLRVGVWEDWGCAGALGWAGFWGCLGVWSWVGSGPGGLWCCQGAFRAVPGVEAGQGTGIGVGRGWGCARVWGQTGDLGCWGQVLGEHPLGGGYGLSPTWPLTCLQAAAVTHGEPWPPTVPPAPAPATAAVAPAPAGPTWWARAATAAHPTSGAWGDQGAASPVAATPHAPCTPPARR